MSSRMEVADPRSANDPIAYLPITRVDNPCAYLPILRAALYTLMTGAKSSEIRDGDRWIKYHQGHVPQLRAEIRKLEQICNANGTVNNSPRAVQAGPHRIIAPYRR